MTPNLLVLDTKDDRREIHGLLHHLPPRDRIGFLVACCHRCPPQRVMPHPVVTGMLATLAQAYRCDRADGALTNEVYADLLNLMNVYRLDAAATTLLLVEWVKRPDVRRVPAPPPAPASAGRGPASSSTR